MKQNMILQKMYTYAAIEQKKKKYGVPYMHTDSILYNICYIWITS